MQKALISTIFLLLGVMLTSSVQQEVGDTRLSADELTMYKQIMEYRKAQGLSEIPLSISLTYVAQQHCRDLANNKPDRKKKCNAHSWSDQGDWEACCYTIDHDKAECMWDKPAELTDYPSEGFEISAGSSEPEYEGFVMTPDYAVEGWKESYHHNNVIINKDIWKDKEWNAIGVGLYKGFATVWFGASPDPSGKPHMPEE